MWRAPPSSLFVAIAASCLYSAGAHSWVACTDYRGDMNYYQDSECVAYPRGWTHRQSWGGRNLLTPVANGYQIGEGDDAHSPCADGASGGEFGPMCQDFHINKWSSRGAGTRKRAVPVPSYTDEYPSAVYEQGGRYCIAWPMKNHANAACKRNGGGDDTRLYFHPVKSDGTDPTFAEFAKFNIRGPACSGGVNQDSVGDRGAECQMTAEQTGWSSDDFRCNGYTRSPRYCDDTDRSMGTGCFTLPEQMTPGRYTLVWYWVFGGSKMTCGTKYTTCWEVEVVPKGSPKAVKSPTPGTKGSPDTRGLSPRSQECQNSFSQNPEPAKPPPPTPPPSPGPPPGRWGGSPSPPAGCPGGVCKNNGKCNPNKDSSVCGNRMDTWGKTCDSYDELTTCNDASMMFQILCGIQKIQNYCPSRCGGCANDDIGDGLTAKPSPPATHTSQTRRRRNQSAGPAPAPSSTTRRRRRRLSSSERSDAQVRLRELQQEREQIDQDIEHLSDELNEGSNSWGSSSNNGFRSNGRQPSPPSNGWGGGASWGNAGWVDTRSKLRNVNDAKCSRYASKDGFFQDCNGNTMYQFPEATMTLNQYCEKSCDRVNLIESGMLPDSVVHTELNKDRAPVEMLMLTGRNKYSAEDSWQEPEAYPPVAEVESSEPVHKHAMQIDNPQAWIIYRSENALGGTRESEQNTVNEWHCKFDQGLPTGRYASHEIEGDFREPEKNWDEFVTVMVRDETGQKVREITRLTAGATSLRVILKLGEKCYTSFD